MSQSRIGGAVVVRRVHWGGRDPRSEARSRWKPTSRVERTRRRHGGEHHWRGTRMLALLGWLKVGSIMGRRGKNGEGEVASHTTCRSLVVTETYGAP